VKEFDRMSVDDKSPAEETQGWVHITLKSGAKVSARVTRFATKKNGLGATSGFEWTNYGHGELALLHIDVDEIAAVVWGER
jgi:hypothetical protein